MKDMNKIKKIEDLIQLLRANIMGSDMTDDQAVKAMARLEEIASLITQCQQNEEKVDVDKEDVKSVDVIEECPLRITFEAKSVNGRTYIFIPADKYMVLAEDVKNIFLATKGSI